jgi:hypothetical protein
MLDWQTEEEPNWDEKPQPQTAVSPWRRRLVWLVLGFLLLGGGGWYAAGLVQEQIETATGETEADLRQAHGLLRQAAERQDVDLFNLLLSGRDEGWARAQEALIGDGQFLDRPTWGLTHRPELGTDDPVTAVVLAPDLLSAELTAVEPYQFWSIADQEIKTAYLEHTAVYRLGPDRWLYAPPEPDFWGETAEISDEFLHLTFPERDRDVVEQLFPNLNALLANTFRLPGLSEGQAVRVEFVTDPTLVGLTLNDAITNPDEPILLPTPTLLGQPQDAAGYEFLWLAYGRYLSSAIITQQVRTRFYSPIAPPDDDNNISLHATNYICCHNAFIFQALLHYQLVQLNLFDWPLYHPTAYHQLDRDNSYEQRALDAAWQSDSLYDWLPFLTIDFLEENNDGNSFYDNLLHGHPIPTDLRAAYTLADNLLSGHQQTAADLQRKLGGYDNLLDWYNGVSPTPAQSLYHLSLQLADHVTRYRPTTFPYPRNSLTITCGPVS